MTHAAVVAVRAIGAACDRDDLPAARAALAALVGTVDQRDPILGARCCDLAVRARDPRLALHFALGVFVGRRGRRDSVVALHAIAVGLPGLATPAQRMLDHRADAGALVAIAAADPFGHWPAIEAFDVHGRHAAATLDELVHLGRARPLQQGRPTTWRVCAARVTWTGTTWAIGAAAPDGRQPARLVPELSAGNCGAALGWIDSEQPDRSATGIALVTSTWPFSNYFHWLVDGLADLLAIVDAGHVEPIVVTVPDPTPSFVPDSLAALGLDDGRVELCRAPFDIEVPSVVVPERDAVPLPRLGAMLRHRLALPESAGRRRILVSRDDASTRRIVNEHVLIDTLAPLGFEVVRPGALTFDEQVAVFTDADLVVAPHGAAQANLLLSPPGATLIELTQQRHPPRSMRGFVGALGHRYVEVPTAPAPERPDDLVADPAAVVAAVCSAMNG